MSLPLSGSNTKDAKSVAVDEHSAHLAAADTEDTASNKVNDSALHGETASHFASSTVERRAFHFSSRSTEESIIAKEHSTTENVELKKEEISEHVKQHDSKEESASFYTFENYSSEGSNLVDDENVDHKRLEKNMMNAANNLAEIISQKVTEGKELMKELIIHERSSVERKDRTDENLTSENGNQDDELVCEPKLAETSSKMRFEDLEDKLKSTTSHLVEKFNEGAERLREFINEETNKSDSEESQEKQHEKVSESEKISPEKKAADSLVTSTVARNEETTVQPSAESETEEMGADLIKNYESEPDVEAVHFGTSEARAKDMLTKGINKAKKMVSDVIHDKKSDLSDLDATKVESPIVKKIVAEGEDVPTQVGTLDSEGVYHDDYGKESHNDAVLTDVDSNKVSTPENYDRRIEGIFGDAEVISGMTKTVIDRTTQEIQLESGDIIDDDHIGLNIDSGKDIIEERMEKITVIECGIYCGCDKHRGEQQAKAETPQLDLHQTTSTGIVEAELTSLTPEAAHEIPGKLSDLPPDEFQASEENKYATSFSDKSEDSESAGPFRSRLEDKSQSFDIGCVENAEQANFFDDDNIAGGLSKFLKNYEKKRSESLSSEEHLRNQLSPFGPAVPIPVHFEDARQETLSDTPPTAFGVAGPGEQLIKTVMVHDEPQSALLYPIPAENDEYDDDSDVVEENVDDFNLPHFEISEKQDSQVNLSKLDSEKLDDNFPSNTDEAVSLPIYEDDRAPVENVANISNWSTFESPSNFTTMLQGVSKSISEDVNKSSIKNDQELKYNKTGESDTSVPLQKIEGRSSAIGSDHDALNVDSIKSTSTEVLREDKRELKAEEVSAPLIANIQNVSDAKSHDIQQFPAEKLEEQQLKLPKPDMSEEHQQLSATFLSGIEQGSEAYNITASESNAEVVVEPSVIEHQATNNTVLSQTDQHDDNAQQQQQQPPRRKCIIL